MTRIQPGLRPYVCNQRDVWMAAFLGNAGEILLDRSQMLVEAHMRKGRWPHFEMQGGNGAGL